MSDYTAHTINNLNLFYFNKNSAYLTLVKILGQ